jgi:hypothetical protein
LGCRTFAIYRENTGTGRKKKDFFPITSYNLIMIKKNRIAKQSMRKSGLTAKVVPGLTIPKKQKGGSYGTETKKTR